MPFVNTLLYNFKVYFVVEMHAVSDIDRTSIWMLEIENMAFEIFKCFGEF